MTISMVVEEFSAKRVRCQLRVTEKSYQKPLLGSGFDPQEPRIVKPLARNVKRFQAVGGLVNADASRSSVRASI
jgi:hypothetical protein